MKDDKTIKKGSKPAAKQRKPGRGRGDRSYHEDREPVGGDKPYLKGPNDIKWRTGDDVATKLAANLPFGLPAGALDEISTLAGTQGTPIGVSQPGIMVIETQLTLGSATDYNSPINLAARKSYSYIRHANSGSKNYEANDLAIYYGACGQAYALLGWMQRIYNSITTFSLTNRYIPKGLVTAQRLDYDDLKKHQAELAWLIAWTGRALGSLAVPHFSYFDACYEAYQFVFVDNASPKEQYYLLNPISFFKFDPVGDSNGGSLVRDVPATTPFGGFDWIYSYVHDLMDVLLGDEDIGVMAGDILKAYGTEGLFVPKALGDYDIIKNSPEMLQQIHNCSIIDQETLILDKYVQNPGLANSAPYLVASFIQGTAISTTTGYTALDGDVLDAFSAVPDAQEVVNCTVLKANVFGLDADSKADPSKVSFDLILPVAINIWTALHDITTGKFTQYATTLGTKPFPCTNYNITSFAGQSFLPLMALASNFDWHPLGKFYQSTTVTTWLTLDHKVFVIGDIQNMRFFSSNVFKRIHENSMLNLFNYMGNNFSNTK